jgi:hypothetical protein
MNGARALCAVCFGVLLAGCAGGANWTKAGLDEAATAREYQDCQDLAGTAVRTDADIDQDIQAARQSDLQRSSVVRVGSQNTRDQTHDRADAIVAACMKAKGFIPAP